MADRNESFHGSYRGAKGLVYNATKLSDTEAAVDAIDPKGNASFARFDLDPDLKTWEVQEGSMDIHPEHEGPEYDVRRNMRRIVNGRF